MRPVAQQQIAFAGDVAEIADARELPIQPDRANKGRAGDLIAVDVVSLQSSGIGVAQEHIAGACQFKPTVPMKPELVIAFHPT